MTDKRTGGRGRRRSVSSGPALTGLDQRLLGVLCAHRVVTQAQLGRLFPDVPERTLRYRTRRLNDLGLAGRSRPYREEGSSPNHHWPTRRADCLMRGDPVPRGGERKRPNPVFLAHATALTELYVLLATRTGEAGLSLHEYRREGEAREPFMHERKDRALAPDAMVVFIDPDGRKLRAFIEIDLGTMSHARLRQKAELYGAYAASEAWRERHPFLPALLFLTTTDIRAGRFLKALAGMLSDGPRKRMAFVAAGAGVAWTPGRLLDGPCLADLDRHDGLALLDVLDAARAPYEQAVAAERAREEAEEEKRRELQTQPEAMRKHLHVNKSTLHDYARRLGPGEQTFELLIASEKEPTPEERTTLNAIARDLDQVLPDLRLPDIAKPDATAISEMRLLTEHYLARQSKRVEELKERDGNAPSLLRAWKQLCGGELLDQGALDRLPAEAERDAKSRVEQQERRDAYLQWREDAAMQLARNAGPLGRLTHKPQDFYAQLDHETLKVCRRCQQTIYPPAQSSGSYGRAKPECHYCKGDYSMDTYSST